METTQQLEEKLKEKIHPSLMGKISMVNEQDIFQKYYKVLIHIYQVLILSLFQHYFYIY